MPPITKRKNTVPLKPKPVIERCEYTQALFDEALAAAEQEMQEERVEWFLRSCQTSRKGNLWTKLPDGTCVTLYKQDGWHFCIACSDDDRTFSPAFDSREDAVLALLEKLEERGWFLDSGKTPFLDVLGVK